MVGQSPEPGVYVTNARLFKSTMDKDQTTTPGTTCPTLYDKCVGSLTSPADQNNEDAGDGAHGLCKKITPALHTTYMYWWQASSL